MRPEATMRQATTPTGRRRGNTRAEWDRQNFAGGAGASTGRDFNPRSRTTGRPKPSTTLKEKDVKRTWRANSPLRARPRPHRSYPKSSLGAGIFGNSQTQTRTADTTIFSRVLYQLSYLAATADPSVSCALGMSARGAPSAAPAIGKLGLVVVIVAYRAGGGEDVEMLRNLGKRCD
jgi:hypothetical protein